MVCSGYVRTNGRIDGGDWSADICVNYTNHHIQVDACRRLYIRMVVGVKHCCNRRTINSCMFHS